MNVDENHSVKTLWFRFTQTDHNFCDVSWLFSSVGIALYRYRKGPRFKSRTGLNFFQVFFQLLVQ